MKLTTAIINKLQECNLQEEMHLSVNGVDTTVTFLARTNGEYIYYFFEGGEELHQFEHCTMLIEYSFLYIIKGFVAGMTGWEYR